MKKKICSLSMVLFLSLVSFAAFSQNDSLQYKQDVASIDQIMKAMYEVISGPAGPRDWNRFKNLYHEKAYMGAVFNKADGTSVYRNFTPEEYIKRNAPFFLEKSFHERELGRKVMQFNDVATVFSAYEFEIADKKQRGVNSIQLVFSDKRWWITSIIWEEESKEKPLPNFLLEK